MVFTHYENIPMQNTEIFKVVKNENFLYKIVDNFLFFFLLKTEIAGTR